MAKKKAGESKEEPTSTPEGKNGEELTIVKPEKVEIATPKKETAQPAGKKGEDGGTEDKTFTQEEVNVLLGKVRGEARESATKAFLEEIGVDSAENIKSSLTKLADIEREALTEQERLLADLNTAQLELEKAQGAQTKSKELADLATINAEIAKHAAERFQSVDAVLKLIDRKDISLDDGKISGVSEALDVVEANYPFTLRKAGVSIVSPTNPAGAKGGPGKTDEQRHTEYFGMGQASEFWDGQEIRQIAEE